MIIKGHDIPLSKHFSSKEFDCSCKYAECTTTPINDALIQLLEQFRAAVGTALHINSGYRCDRHNRDVGGEDHSQHPLGTAADVARSDGMRWTDTDRLMAEHIFADHGLGTYVLPNGGYLWFHLDCRDGRARWEKKV